MSTVKMIRGDEVKICEHDWQIEACTKLGFKEDKPKPKGRPKKKDDD